MKKQHSDVASVIRDVFSLAPVKEAEVAAGLAVRDYFDFPQETQVGIHWAEFQQDGSFVRAGISFPAQLTSQLLPDPGLDPRTKEVSQTLKRQDVRVGDVIHSQNGGEVFWLVPCPIHEEADEKKPFCRSIALDETVLQQVIDFYNPDSKLTPAEVRASFQLIAGLSLEDASVRDGVSVETKRTHVKRVMQKLLCRKRSDLIRLLVTQLQQIVYLCNFSPSELRLSEQFDAKHIRGAGQLSVFRTSSGQLLRFWEFGPYDGEPLLVHHGLLFPLVATRCLEQLSQFGIKVILPLRSGYLDGRRPANSEEFESTIKESIDNIEEFLKKYIGRKVTVAGFHTGSSYALMSFCRNPDLYNSCLICSGHFFNRKGYKKEGASRFLSGYYNSIRNSKIYKSAYDHFMRSVISNRLAASILFKKLFESNKDDALILAGSKAHESSFEMFFEICRSSLPGISCDLYAATMLEPDLAAPYCDRVTFIHGSKDGLTEMDVIESLHARLAGSRLHRIEAAGVYAAISHPQSYWQEVKKRMQKVA